MLSPSELVYFLHIPKTSGVSVVHFLTAAYGHGRVSRTLVWDDLLAGHRQLDDSTRVIAGHFAGLLPLWLHTWPRIITMLREPLARAVSHINHVQRDSAHVLHPVGHGLSVLEYCRHPGLRKTVENFQARYLASLSLAAAVVAPAGADLPYGSRAVAAENALYALDRQGALCEEALRAVDMIDAVGLCEAHAASMQLFACTLGLPPPRTAEVRLNVGPAGHRLADLSAEETAALRSLNEIDTAMYHHARSVFVDRCRRNGIGLRMESGA